MISKKKKKEIVFLTQVQKLISMEVSHIVALYKFPIAYAKSWSKYRCKGALTFCNFLLNPHFKGIPVVACP